MPGALFPAPPALPCHWVWLAALFPGPPKPRHSLLAHGRLAPSLNIPSPPYPPRAFAVPTLALRLSPPIPKEASKEHRNWLRCLLALRSALPPGHRGTRSRRSVACSAIELRR